MDEKTKIRVVEISIITVAAIMFILPLSFWLIAQGFFGKMVLVGKSSFSPVMDRLFLLSVMFFVMYGVSWMNTEIKYRSAKVFGVVALLALLSIPAIQFDNVLIPQGLDQQIREVVNLWFLNFPSYVVMAITTGMPLGWQVYLTMAFFAIISGVILWDIKVELAKGWGQAINMWWVFELVYLILVWIIFRVMKIPMFPPTIV